MTCFSKGLSISFVHIYKILVTNFQPIRSYKSFFIRGERCRYTPRIHLKTFQQQMNRDLFSFSINSSMKNSLSEKIKQRHLSCSLIILLLIVLIWQLQADMSQLIAKERRYSIFFFLAYKFRFYPAFLCLSYQGVVN